ncbi:MAG: GNAT family N-acetyltransferase [Gemmatimonadaceae bacterium]
MRIDLPLCAVRDWEPRDLDRLVRFADNRKIWKNLRDRFPSPYTRAAGEEWIANVTSAKPRTSFVIAVGDELVGSIGVIPGTDIYARSAEVGYWLGEEYWGKGLAAEALSGFVPWAFAEFNLARMWAAVFVTNPGSARVLEKAGFVREATFANAAVKDGEVLDEWIYARTSAT